MYIVGTEVLGPRLYDRPGKAWSKQSCRIQMLGMAPQMLCVTLRSAVRLSQIGWRQQKRLPGLPAAKVHLKESS